jgi:hypothetical protein
MFNLAVDEEAGQALPRWLPTTKSRSGVPTHFLDSDAVLAASDTGGAPATVPFPGKVRGGARPL